MSHQSRRVDNFGVGRGTGSLENRPKEEALSDGGARAFWANEHRRRHKRWRDAPTRRLMTIGVSGVGTTPSGRAHASVGRILEKCSQTEFCYSGLGAAVYIRMAVGMRGMEI